ncbi:MAG: hypothetical protein LUC41_09120 [Clostridiales bacterium]|nr:hypothetical protein [Clostridiales bacterium]
MNTLAFVIMVILVASCGSLILAGISRFIYENRQRRHRETHIDLQKIQDEMQRIQNKMQLILDEMAQKKE